MEAIVELLAKLQREKQKTEEDLAYEETQRLINSDFEPSRKLVEVGLKRVLLDLMHVVEVIELDDEYIQIVMKHTTIYIIKIGYEDFKTIYSQLTHRQIHEVKE